MIFLKQIFLLIFCILGSLQGEILESEVDTELTSSILRYLNERNPSYFHRDGRILHKTVKDNTLEVTFDIEAICEFPCLGGVLQCESVFQKIRGEPIWRIATAICAPKEPAYVEQRKNFLTHNEKQVSERNKEAEEPKVVQHNVQDPKIIDGLFEEPKIVHDVIEEPKIVHDYVEQPKIVDDFVENPKRVYNGVEPQLKPFEINDNNAKKIVPCVGCPVDINPDANGVSNLINTALRHIESERSEKHTALKVLRVQQQVVAGIKYNLLIEVAPTVCPKSLDTPSCPLDQSKGSFVCEIEFWEKSWERFSQVIRNNCTNVQEFAYYNPIDTTPKTPEREVDFGDLESQILSDYDIQQSEPVYNKDDGEIVDALAWISSKILDYKNYKVVGSSKVILDGLHYKLQLLLEKDRMVIECTVFMTVKEGNIYDSTIDKYRCNTDDVWQNNHREDRKNNVLGAAISVEDPQVKLFLKDGLTQLDKSSTHTNRYKILRVVEATKQLVSGVLYRIKAQVTVSDCEKGNDEDLETCGVLKDAPVKECFFKIWNQPWLPQGIQTNVTCENYEPSHFRLKRSRGTLAGGINPIPKDDPQVKLYLKDGLTNMDQSSPHAHKYKVLEILESSSQVVSGSLHRIKARVTVSDCEKSSNVDSDTCGVLKDAPVKVCNFKIWNQPWLPKGRETNVTCENDEVYHFRQRRSLLGSPNAIPTDDPQVKLHLKNGLAHLDESSPHTNKYKVLDVVEASKQIVSGVLYRIKAHVTISDCEKETNADPETCGVLKDAPVKECNFKIWSQPWLPQGTQTNITCGDEEHSFRQRRSANFPALEDAVGLYFKHFQLRYSKNYPSKAESKHRLRIFKQNLNMIDLLNKYEQGTAIYGVNQYADLTPAEFSKLHGLRTDLQSENYVPFPEAKIPDIDLPTSLDWRDKNAVTAVKDQGSCGSCWAFSTTGNVEGQYAIKYKNLKSFSEQELVDCDKIDDGCNGGLMDNAYRAIENLGGLELENQYPYDARDEKCHFNKSKVVVHVSGALNISHNETDMAKWLTQNGPISIAINANAMQFYMGGISHPYKIFCSPNDLDHGVLIVGYDVHTTTIRNKVLPYWIVKNSWGADWGEKGYYRVYRGDGTCGLNQTPSSAVVS